MTVPAAVGEQIRHLAAELGQPVSALVTAGLMRELRHHAVGDAVRDALERSGPIDPATAADVGAVFDAAARRTPAGRGTTRSRRTPRR